MAERIFHEPAPVGSRFGKLVTIPRRIVWKLVRPYLTAFFADQQAQLDAQQAALDSKVASVKKDLMATNRRIDWNEESGKDAL